MAEVRRPPALRAARRTGHDQARRKSQPSATSNRHLQFFALRVQSENSALVPFLRCRFSSVVAADNLAVCSHPDHLRHEQGQNPSFGLARTEFFASDVTELSLFALALALRTRDQAATLDFPRHHSSPPCSAAPMTQWKPCPRWNARRAAFDRNPSGRHRTCHA